MKPLQLTKKNFKNNKINLNKPGLLLVRANWCGHCVRYMPEYERLAKLFPENGDFLITHIESEELKDSNVKNVLENFVEYYPTLLFFDKRGNIVQRYNGENRDNSTMLKKICSVYKVCK